MTDWNHLLHTMNQCLLFFFSGSFKQQSCLSFFPRKESIAYAGIELLMCRVWAAGRRCYAVEMPARNLYFYQLSCWKTLPVDITWPTVYKLYIQIPTKRYLPQCKFSTSIEQGAVWWRVACGAGPAANGRRRESEATVARGVPLHKPHRRERQPRLPPHSHLYFDPAVCGVKVGMVHQHVWWQPAMW